MAYLLIGHDNVLLVLFFFSSCFLFLFIVIKLNVSICNQINFNFCQCTTVPGATASERQRKSEHDLFRRLSFWDRVWPYQKPILASVQGLMCACLCGIANDSLAFVIIVAIHNEHFGILVHWSIDLLALHHCDKNEQHHQNKTQTKKH